MCRGEEDLVSLILFLIAFLTGVRVSAGTVAYITTGAPIPAGADAVVPIEDTERLPGDKVT